MARPSLRRADGLAMEKHGPKGHAYRPDQFRFPRQGPPRSRVLTHTNPARLTIPGYEIGPAVPPVALAVGLSGNAPRRWLAGRHQDTQRRVSQQARRGRAAPRISHHTALTVGRGVIRVHALEPYGNGNVAMVLEPFGRSLADQYRRRKAIERYHWTRFFPSRSPSPRRSAECMSSTSCTRTSSRAASWSTIPVRVRLIDFSISSELSRERPNYAWSRQLEGALPYMSPEQTGRMNRDLDYRSDFYSLGVTSVRDADRRAAFPGRFCSRVGSQPYQQVASAARARSIRRSRRPCRRSF